MPTGIRRRRYTRRLPARPLQRRESQLAKYRAQQRHNRSSMSPLLMSFPGFQFMPERVLTKLRYCTEGIIQASAIKQIEDIVIRANSVFDPEYAVGGGQPLGFDQITPLYGAYRVHACKVKFTVCNNSSAAMNFCLLPTKESTSFLNYLDACEQPHAKAKSISAKGGADLAVLANKQLSKKILGLKELDDDEEADVTTNPDNQWFFHLITSTQQWPSSTYLDYSYKIEVIYNVEFFERKAVARS